MRAIATYVDRQPTDLIVLATEGRQGPGRWFHRSEAEAAARWSRTMALFVPAGAKRGLVALEDGDVTLKHVLVPMDHAPDCATAVKTAMRTAEILGDGTVSITLLHVGESPPAVPALTQGAAWAWQVDYREGDPVDGILTAADNLTADLIVMGTAGHDGVLDALRGSITEQVLRRAPCPVLAVPAGP